jgi:hypothetical protein
MIAGVAGLATPRAGWQVGSRQVGIWRARCLPAYLLTCLPAYLLNQPNMREMMPRVPRVHLNQSID